MFTRAVLLAAHIFFDSLSGVSQYARHTWKLFFVGLQPDLVLGEDVGAVEVKGDPSESHGFALGAEQSGTCR